MDTAQAAVQSQQATVSQVQAAISQAEAGLNQSQVNLAHTVITAPIDGLVISRSVDVGQTVAASMQAPTLFVLAADLTKMQVVANLDESDVGRIRPNQTVTFRVDAYAQDMFRGTVSQVRLEPKVQQNVVTYATVIDVPNNDLRLKPGMTANVNIEISRASNVLRISNSALRFRPSNDVFAALGQTPPEPQGRGGLQGGGRRADTANGAGPEASSAPGTSSAPGNGPSGSGAANQADPSHTQPSASAARRSSDPAASAPRADAPGAGQNAKGNAPHGAEGSAPAQGSSQADDDRRKRLAERMQLAGQMRRGMSRAIVASIGPTT